MTFATFAADMAGLVVTGVRRRFDAPPAQLSTAVLPAQYSRFLELSAEVATLASGIGLFKAACEIVIVVNPAGQDNNNPNFDATLTLMSALDTAIRTEAADNVIDLWTMRMEVEQFGATPYWVIIARIEASG